MSVLDVEIRALFGEVFGSIYDDGILTAVTITPVRGGTNTVSTSTYSVKAQQNTCNERMRNEEGYSAQDIMIIVLQQGLPVEITTDHKIALNGKNWSVESVVRDPVNSYFETRARELK